MATIKKVDLRNKEYRRCTCCETIQHVYQFWNADANICGACNREKCTSRICRLGTLHDK